MCLQSKKNLEKKIKKKRENYETILFIKNKFTLSYTYFII